MGEKFAGADSEAERAVVLGAATYGVAVLSSGFFAAYAILLPGAGIGVIGRVMLKAGFSRLAGYLGVTTAVLAVLAVLGPIVVDVGDVAVISRRFSPRSGCWWPDTSSSVPDRPSRDGVARQQACVAGCRQSQSARSIREVARGTGSTGRLWPTPR